MRFLVTASLLGVAAIAAVPTPSGAEDATCQGRVPTIVGPTDGHKTIGTEGDDVIIAPLYDDSAVQALGGNDTMCLVGDEAISGPHPHIPVDAGAGDDTVVNERTAPIGDWQVILGAGSDYYSGNDFSDGVATGNGVEPDTDRDVIATYGGDDSISSGAGVPTDAENPDVISTGAGNDGVYSTNPAGVQIDNGTGTDALYLSSTPPGTEEVIDNAGGRLKVAGRVVMTWTNISHFVADYLGSADTVSFIGTNRDESLWLRGPSRGLAPGGGSIGTGGGDDEVTLTGYLPSKVGMGVGRDVLTYEMYFGCSEASIELDTSADCTTLQGPHISTRLAGIEDIDARTRLGLEVAGTTHRNDITATSSVVRVSAGAGADHVQVKQARVATVRGGRGDDELKGIAKQGLVLRGGPGADFLRGWTGPDRIYGGEGHDIAAGRGGTDYCLAEIRRGCERP